MPTVLGPSTGLLWGAVGFVTGFALASGLCLAWRSQDRRFRRLVVGFAANALVVALVRLEESIRAHAPDLDLRREVGGCRELAAAVAKVAEE